MFHLFRRTDEPSIVCAVPTGIKPPSFLRDAWMFERRATEVESEQLAFDRSAVHALARRNGFYLYARFDDRTSLRTLDHEGADRGSDTTICDPPGSGSPG